VFRLLAARRLLVAGTLSLVVAGLLPASVMAHAELTSADPAPNGSVATAPERLRLTFSEPVDPASVSIELLDTLGRPRAGLGPARVAADGLTVETTLPGLESGVFTVSYQVVSSVDGHATAGVYAFLIDPTGAAPPPADSASASSPSVDGFTIAARLLALAALLVAFGSMLLWRGAGRRTLAGRGLDPGPPWTLVGAASLAGAIGVVAYLWLSARPIAGPGTGIPLDIAAPFGWTPFAIAMRVSFVAAVVGGIGALLNARWSLVAGLLALALAGMSLAGHVASAGGPAFAVLDWIHLAGVAAWLGALPAALVLGRRSGVDRSAATTDILRAHGRVALVAAPIVALSGIANSPLVLGQGRDLVASDYGNLLVAKAVLLAVAIGIGAVNHLALRGRGRAAVLGLVAAELVVAVMAVSAAATMVTIQPASARQPVLATAPVHPAHFFGQLDSARVHLAVSLPAPGTQAYRVTVRDADSGAPPADVQKVFIGFSPPGGAGLPSQRVELEADPLGGLWVASGAYTPLVGDWGLEVIVRRQGREDAALSFPLEVLAIGSAELGPPPDTGISVPAPVAAAWSLLPAGLLGWVPSVAALFLIAGLWRLPRSAARDAARVATLAVLVLATIGVGTRTLVEAANAPTPGDLARQPELAPPDLARGIRLYRANCASCHGADGHGDGPVDAVPAPGPLAGAVGSATDAELSYRISYGVAGTSMPSFAGKFTAEERSDLIGYLRDRFGGP
jgi:copper transport protein